MRNVWKIKTLLTYIPVKAKMQLKVRRHNVELLKIGWGGVMVVDKRPTIVNKI